MRHTKWEYYQKDNSQVINFLHLLLLISVENSIHWSNLGSSSMVPNSMASSKPCLTQDEKDKGVCLVDILKQH
jgi:cell division ATPase FtsA